MQSISRIISLIIHMLIFGDVFSMYGSEHGDTADEWCKLPKEKFENRIPKQFMFGKTVYEVERIKEKTDINEEIYNKLYQVVPVDKNGKHILKFIQVSAEEDLFMADVPAYFLALYGCGGAIFETHRVGKSEEHVSHRLKPAREAATNRKIKVIVPRNVKKSGKLRSEPVAFVKIPEIKLSQFDFRSFSPILDLTPSENKITECTLEPSKHRFHNNFFKTSHIFSMNTDSTNFNQTWSLELVHDPPVYKKEPRKIMVYSMGNTGGIELNEMKCKWKEKLEDAEYVFLRSENGFVIKKHSNEEYNMPMLLLDKQPRFYYYLQDETDSPNDVILVENKTINMETGEAAVKYIYKNRDIFGINGLHTIVAAFYFRCNNSKSFVYLPHILPEWQTMSLKRFREQRKNLCGHHKKIVNAPKTDKPPLQPPRKRKS